MRRRNASLSRAISLIIFQESAKRPPFSGFIFRGFFQSAFVNVVLALVAVTSAAWSPGQSQHMPDIAGLSCKIDSFQFIRARLKLNVSCVTITVATSRCSIRAIRVCEKNHASCRTKKNACGDRTGFKQKDQTDVAPKTHFVEGKKACGNRAGIDKNSEVLTFILLYNSWVFSVGLRQCRLGSRGHYIRGMVSGAISAYA